MRSNTAFGFPLSLSTTTPAWALPTPIDDEPINKEVRAYLTECFFLLPHRIGYSPGHRCIIADRGQMNVPDAYARYPLLSIYFAKFRLRKYPFEALHNDINWPEPYVVLNTIMKRLRSHRFLKGNADADIITEKIRQIIAPDLEIPNGLEDEVLEMPYSERKASANNNRVTKVLQGQNTRDDVAKFFDELLGSEHSQLYSDQAIIHLEAEYPIRSQADLTVLTQYLRKLWYIEKILTLYDRLPDTVRDSERDLPSTEIWRTLEDLQAYVVHTPSQDEMMTKVANLLKLFPEEVDELRQHRKVCRTFIYDMIRAWLPKEKLKIYRGTHALDDGSIKVSLNFTEYSFIKFAFIFFQAVPSSGGDSTGAEKVLITFECRHNAGDSSGSNEERDIKVE